MLSNNNDETDTDKLNYGEYVLQNDDDGTFEEADSFCDDKNDIDSISPKEVKWYKKQCATNICLFVLGIFFTLGAQVLCFEVGLIQLPDTGSTLNAPECYACVNLAPLDGKYVSMLDVKVTGIEFKVKTIQIYHGDSSTVDTIVDVVKDPSGIFYPCECDGVGFKLSPINCSLIYMYDKCVDDCDEKNGITEEFTLYDPKLDQIESNVVVSVLGQDIHQVAIFTRVNGDDDDTTNAFVASSR